MELEWGLECLDGLPDDEKRVRALQRELCDISVDAEARIRERELFCTSIGFHLETQIEEEILALAKNTTRIAAVCRAFFCYQLLMSSIFCFIAVVSCFPDLNSSISFSILKTNCLACCTASSKSASFKSMLVAAE